MNIATKAGRLIRYDNPKVLAPPGILTPENGKPIIVASLMRSGTHLLIDSLLNNCQLLRRKPLYIDLDQYLQQRGTQTVLQDIPSAGHYIVKTHFPQLGGEEQSYTQAVTQLAETAAVIKINRSQDEIVASYKNFAEEELPEDFASTYQKFNDFWNPRSTVEITFRDLLSHWDASMEKIWQALNLTPDQKKQYPPKRSQKNKVYFDKFLTRIFGKSAPCINTTIGFALSSSKKSSLKETK